MGLAGQTNTVRTYCIIYGETCPHISRAARIDRDAATGTERKVCLAKCSYSAAFLTFLVEQRT